MRLAYYSLPRRLHHGEIVRAHGRPIDDTARLEEKLRGQTSESINSVCFFVFRQFEIEFQISIKCCGC